MRYFIAAKTFRPLILYSFSGLLLGNATTYAMDTSARRLDAHIRQVVDALLKEKDEKIQALEARIEHLSQSPQLLPFERQPESPLNQAEAQSFKASPSLISSLNKLGQKAAALQQDAAKNSIPMQDLWVIDNTAKPSLINKLSQLSDNLVKLQRALGIKDSQATNANGVKTGTSFIRILGYLGEELTLLQKSAKAKGSAIKRLFTEDAQQMHSSLASKFDDLGGEIASLKAAKAAGNGALAQDATPNSTFFLSKLNDLKEELVAFKQASAQKGLGINGYIDINAKTDNASGQNFKIGYLELDLTYTYNKHFAASSVVLLPGSGGANIWSAFVDYHLFDNTIPPRGRIFNGQGFHVQAGRFDIPFSTDYQNFASTDRLTVTPPITTSRMQFYGYNGTGTRSYGSWSHFNYSAFWTNALYAQDGWTVGGHLGLNLGQNTYRVHHLNPEGIEIGISYLSDLDKYHNLRNAVYGADLSIGYSFLRLQSELMLRQSYHSFIGTDQVDYGKPHELGYHNTLIADLKGFIDYPLLAIARYGRWQPHNRYGQDLDGSIVGIDNVSALTLGLNYTLNSNLKFKLEYTDSLGTSTQEKYFDKRFGVAQMVVAF